MTNSSNIGHNKPPVVAPTEEDLLDDLKTRYPELVKELAEFEVALATYPKEFTLKDEESATALQDLLGKMKKHKSQIAAYKKDEKKPWSGLVNVVLNFFTKSDEKIGELLDEWQPRHQAFMDLKKEESRRKAEEEAEKQRAAAEASRLAAEKARAEEEAAKARAEEERRKEQEERDKAEKAAAEAKAAQERAEAAKAEEKRQADERRARDKAEKDRNEESLRSIKRHMKDVEKLNQLSETEEATPEEAEHLDQLIRHGGIVGLLAGQVANSTLLDEEQRTEIESIRARLNDLRNVVNARLNKREQAKREKARKLAEDAEAKAAAERKAKREEEDRKYAEATKKRLDEEAAAAKAKDEKAVADKAARDARNAARESEADAKDASKEQRLHSTDADRSANRAERIDNKLGNSSDSDLSGTLRGDLGTKGSLTRRWGYIITDEAALREVCGVLGEHFATPALEGAVYRWMGAHQASFVGERIEGRLPGVTFMYEQGSRIAT